MHIEADNAYPIGDGVTIRAAVFESGMPFLVPEGWHLLIDTAALKVRVVQGVAGNPPINPPTNYRRLSIADMVDGSSEARVDGKLIEVISPDHPVIIHFDADSGHYALYPWSEGVAN